MAIDAADLFDFAPLKIRPDDWHPAVHPRPDPFPATWTTTLVDHELELDSLGYSSATLQVDVPPGMVRQNGMLHANARPLHPGVIFTIVTADRTMVMSTDAMATWQSNVRAIALGLHDLRRLDRYGIAKRGQQYAGWAELGDGVPMGTGLAAMSPDHAARLILDGADIPITDERVLELLAHPEQVADLYRLAAAPPHRSRITFALNARQLFGPEVDLACCAAEPDVDEWEAGRRSPSPVQVEALARLTAYPVEWFYRGPLNVDGSVFMCGRGGGASSRQVTVLRDPDPPEGCPALAM